MVQRRITTQRTVTQQPARDVMTAQRTSVYVQQNEPGQVMPAEGEAAVREQTIHERTVTQGSVPVDGSTIQHTYTEVSEEPPVYAETVVEKAPAVVYDNTVYRRDGLVTATRLIWLLAGFLEALIAIRVLLKLIAANPNAGFAQLVYGITEPFLWPFAGLTATPSAGGAVLEIPSIIAIIVYALLASGLVKLLWVLFDRPPAIVR